MLLLKDPRLGSKQSENIQSQEYALSYPIGAHRTQYIQRCCGWVYIGSGISLKNPSIRGDCRGNAHQTRSIFSPVRFLPDSRDILQYVHCRYTRFPERRAIRWCVWLGLKPFELVLSWFGGREEAPEQSDTAEEPYKPVRQLGLCLRRPFERWSRGGSWWLWRLGESLQVVLCSFLDGKAFS